MTIAVESSETVMDWDLNDAARQNDVPGIVGRWRYDPNGVWWCSNV